MFESFEQIKIEIESSLHCIDICDDDDFFYLTGSPDSPLPSLTIRTGSGNLRYKVYRENIILLKYQLFQPSLLRVNRVF